MELVTLANQNKPEFNRFVAAHPSGSFLQSWEWGDWQEHLDQKVHRFFIKDNGNNLLAAQVIQTITQGLNKSYLYIPYGPLLTDASRQDIIEFFITELKKLFPESLFFRIELKDQLELPGKPTLHIQPGKTLMLDLKQSEEQLLNAMHPKTRYNIKVAQKHEVAVMSEPIVTPGYGLHLQESLSLLVDTAQRQGFKSHAPSYYKKLIDFFAMKPESDCQIAIYKAIYQQKLLATAVMIDFGSTRTYLFGGTTQEQKNVMAPYAMHWQAIRDAQSKGLASYDFWGIETASGQTPGFVRFKLGWGGTIINYPPPIDLVQRPTWYTIYNALRLVHRKLS